MSKPSLKLSISTTNSYGGPGGALSSSSASALKSWYGGSRTTNSSTSYAYVIWDDARVATTTYDSDTSSGSNPLWISNYYCDGAGRLASVKIDDDRDRTVSFASNPNGQVLSRIEKGNSTTGDPRDYYYFLDGAQVGELTNNGNHDPTRDTYTGTFVTRNWNFNTNAAPQPFRWNTAGQITAAQLGGSGYDPISPASQGMRGTDRRLHGARGRHARDHRRFAVGRQRALVHARRGQRPLGRGIPCRRHQPRISDR